MSQPTLPKTYKAARITSPGSAFELVDVDLKQPGKDEILLKVLACGCCRSDEIVKEGVMPVLPRIPGHEVVGEVVAVGENVKSFPIGSRAGGGWHGFACVTECDRCREGDYVTCENQGINGITRDGGYAEYVTLNAGASVRIPSDLDPAETAPLLCAGVTTFNSMRHMNAHPGDLVAIQGIGGLGHLAIQYASKMGFKVVALSTSDAKKDLATSLGAAVYVNGGKESQVDALQKLGGAKLIVCTAPSVEVIKELINGLAVDGTLLILAVTQDPIQLPTMPMIQKRLSVRGWPSGTAKDSEAAVAFAKASGVKCQVERFSLEDAGKAYDSMITGKARFRSVIVPGYKG